MLLMGGEERDIEEEERGGKELEGNGILGK